MYEQASHSLLNEIMIELAPELGDQDLWHFYTRLGANFYAIHSVFHLLYGDRVDFKEQMVYLVGTLARRYLERAPALRESDLAREKNFNWFLSQKWVGMALYCDRFADDLKGLRANLPYLQELGVNLLHVMPMLDCPPDNSDGGYAVRDFYRIDPRFGTTAEVSALATTLRLREMLLALDVVVNHTSDEHEWAQRARRGERKYQDYYFTFPDRETPDLYEETMPEIFPETAPGNFTWDAEMGKWVMTVFNHYQWDLNYHNPSVLIEMIDIILFWANQGADILRLDAVAFLWKKIGGLSERARGASAVAVDEGLLPGDRAGRAVHRRGHRRPRRNLQVLRRGRDQRQGMRDRLQRHPHGPAVGRGRHQERGGVEPRHQKPAEQAGTRDLAQLRPLP
jgi:amylosucrase